jgi:hypothetical protein
MSKTVQNVIEEERNNCLTKEKAMSSHCTFLHLACAPTAVGRGNSTCADICQSWFAALIMLLNRSAQ